MRLPPPRAHRERRSRRHLESGPENSGRRKHFPRRRRFRHQTDGILGPVPGQHTYLMKNNSSRYKKDLIRDSSPVARFGLSDNNDGESLSNQNQLKITDNEYLRSTYKDHPRRRKNRLVSPGRALVTEKRVTEEHSCPLISSWNQPNKWWTEPTSPERAITTRSERKLLVLDLNGLLADVTWDCHKTLKAETRINGKAVFKRPFCDDFLKFCFGNFDVGIWSSRKQKNVDQLVCFLFGDMRHNLLFCWDQSKCTSTGFGTIENQNKPLVLKELRKLWNKEDPDLPWKKGFFTPANTLLVDDSPYKALCNLPDTAIFPKPYHYTDKKDCSLGPGGEIRVYLEGLAMAGNVQRYVRSHPFGQPPITSKNPSWKFYQHIIEQLSYISVGHKLDNYLRGSRDQMPLLSINHGKLQISIEMLMHIRVGQQFWGACVRI